MRTFIFLFILAGSIISCGKKASPDTGPATSDSTKSHQSTYSVDSIKGEYIGGFGNNTIVMSVNYVNGNNVSGYNIVKGKRRNIKGTMENQGKAFKFVLEEPGGDAYDGIFSFSIDTATRTLEGTWIAYDSTKVKPQKYKLTRRIYDHEEMEGFTGYWYLNDLVVKLKSDKSGVAEGNWYNEKTEASERVEIPFSWFEKEHSVSIEWSKNNIFLSSKMTFKHEKNEYEEMLVSGDYVMYRY